MEYLKYLQEEKNSRRSSALLTAATIFLSRGIDEVKMTDIADECGLGVASIYRYFGTKTKLLIMVGELLWADARVLFDEAAARADYAELSGFRQLSVLFSVYETIFRYHKDFLRFLRDFDATMLRENVPKAELSSYERGLFEFFDYFKAAYDKGTADRSVRADIDLELFYYSATHMLLSAGQKFIAGAIVESDDDTRAEAEIKIMLDMVLTYISPRAGALPLPDKM